MKHIRKASAAMGDDTNLTRYVKVPKPPVQGMLIKTGRSTAPVASNPSIVAGRSVFHRNGVKHPSEFKHILVSGHSNAKIGRNVRRGKLWRGYHIFTLSLEERATCPSSCEHWIDCYGNNMPYSKRVDHNDLDALTRAIEADIVHFSNAPNCPGILLRLHALGDFFSTQYVWFWDLMLTRYPNLAIYGYTARRPNDDIGACIEAVKTIHKERFRIRWSNGGLEKDCTVSIVHRDERPVGAFQCPEQIVSHHKDGVPMLCATCGLCWDTDKNVSFISH